MLVSVRQRYGPLLEESGGLEDFNDLIEELDEELEKLSDLTDPLTFYLKVGGSMRKSRTSTAGIVRLCRHLS